MAEENLHKFLVQDKEFENENYELALKNAFLKTDQLILEKASKNVSYNDGSTAVAILIVDSNLYVANVGDSEAVLGRKKSEDSGNVETIILTTKHTPTNEYERKRLEDIQCPLFGNRVCGVLAVSRSLGDKTFKAPFNQQTYNYVIAEPNIKTIDITSTDEFILIACDGLWDTIKYKDAIEFIASYRWNGKTPVQSCEQIVKEALSEKTMDNVTVIIVYLKAPKTLHK